MNKNKAETKVKIFIKKINFHNPNKKEKNIFKNKAYQFLKLTLFPKLIPIEKNNQEFNGKGQIIKFIKITKNILHLSDKINSNISIRRKICPI